MEERRRRRRCELKIIINISSWSYTGGGPRYGGDSGVGRRGFGSCVAPCRAPADLFPRGKL